MIKSACIADTHSHSLEKFIGGKMKRLILFVTLTILLSACSTAQPEIPTSTSNQSIAQSATDVQLTTEPITYKPSNTAIPSATFTEPPSPTPPNTITPIIERTSTATEIANTPTVACTNLAELVSHLSFSDGSIIGSGIYFGKAWRVKNTGSCTWTSEYRLVFISGEPMKSPPEVPLVSEIAPGETLDIKVTLFSPMVDGKYSSNWMLRDPSGHQFGFGELADQPLSANLIVQTKPQVDKFPAPECG